MYINRRWGDSPECGCNDSAARRLHSIQNVTPCAMKEGNSRSPANSRSRSLQEWRSSSDDAAELKCRAFSYPTPSRPLRLAAPLQKNPSTRNMVYKKHRKIETSLSLECVSYFLIVKFQKDKRVIVSYKVFLINHTRCNV